MRSRAIRNRGFPTDWLVQVIPQLRSPKAGHLLLQEVMEPNPVLPRRLPGGDVTRYLFHRQDDQLHGGFDTGYL